MKVNILQLKIEELPEKNIEKVASLTKVYKDEVFLLPELFTTGFNYEVIDKYIDRQTIFLNMLPHQNTYIGSIPVSKDGEKYNTMFIKSGERLSFLYNKIHLFFMMNEDSYFSPGKDVALFQLDDFKCGCAICFDLRFPELFRKYFLQDADIIFIPMQWPRERVLQMIPLAQARAIENQCYIVVSNAIGKIWGTFFGGNSMLISPVGEIITNACEVEDEVFSLNIDKNIVKEFKTSMPLKQCIKLL